MSTTSDCTLMTRVRDGEISELGTLFERHHRKLYGFCLRLTGSPPISEDLVQEAFCRILKYRHTFRDGGDFMVWAYQLTRNVCADHFRKHGRAATVPLDDDEHRGGREPVSPLPLPSDQLASSEALTLLGRALGALPLDKRELLVLARFQGLKYEQIGALLGCTVGAVKVRVHRAVRQLRDEYHSLANEVPT